MLRNIRRFYWKQRDRGQGRKTVMAVLVFFLFVAIIVAAIIKSMMGGHHAGLQTVHKTNTASVSILRKMKNETKQCGVYVKRRETRRVQKELIKTMQQRRKKQL